VRTRITLTIVIISLAYVVVCYGPENKVIEDNMIVRGPCVSEKTQQQSSLPTVVVVTTGGTIAEKHSPKTGAAVPAISGCALVRAVPGLDTLAYIQVVPFSNIDSSHMTPEMWRNLSARVDEILQDSEVKGVVVTHGTDTMAEGAYFLDVTLTSKKPVVFVGAMRDASDLSPDGPANIYNAVLQVTSKEAQHFGVTVTLNQYINSARYVRKTETTNVQTFNSGENGYLGYIAMGKVHKFHERIPAIKLALPKKLANVALLQTYAGDNGNFIRYAVDQGAQGIVVEAVGAGNVNPQVFDAIKYALSKKIVVAIATRVFNGSVYPIYGDVGGGKSLQEAGAVLVGDMTGQKARLLLMLALSNQASIEDIKNYFKF
jgi:L-asparaginase